MPSSRLTAEQRRELILERSKRLFARKGYNGVSMSELARECGVSPAVIYQHFPSKKALYREVLQTYACARDDFLEALLEGDEDFPETLFRLTRAYLKARLRDRDTTRMELRSIADEDDMCHAIYESQWSGLATYVEAMLRERRTKESDLDNARIHAETMAYIGMVREALIRLGLQAAPGKNEPDIDALCRVLVSTFMNGVLSQVS